MVRDRFASRTVGTPIPAGAHAPRKEVRVIDPLLIMVLLIVILWMTRR